MKAVVAALSLSLAPALVLAQVPEPYPSRAVTLVVNVAPGGGGDVLARLIGPKLAESMKQPFVVENKVGASGVIGADFVAKSAPNGYTLLVVPNSYTISPALYKNMPFDPVADQIGRAHI